MSVDLSRFLTLAPSRNPTKDPYRWDILDPASDPLRDRDCDVSKEESEIGGFFT